MSRITKECSRGHVFEPDYPDSEDCPFCAQMERGGYRSKKTLALDDKSAPIETKLRPGSSEVTGTGRTGLVGSSKTVSLGDSDVVDPVVGWLVATAGPLRGKDFRIPPGRSSFGRDPGCRICIAGDLTVSSHQGYINYSRNRRFTMSPGEGSSLLYVDGVEVLSPIEVQPYAVIEMGKTVMTFIPFCGERFDWSEFEEGN